MHFKRYASQSQMNALVHEIYVLNPTSESIVLNITSNNGSPSAGIFHLCIFTLIITKWM